MEQLKNSRKRGQGREKYIDELFPPVEASIFSNSVHRKGHMNRTKDEIVWMRLSEIYPKSRVFTRDREGSNVRIWRGEKGIVEGYLVTGFNTIKGCGELLSQMF